MPDNDTITLTLTRGEGNWSMSITDDAVREYLPDGCDRMAPTGFGTVLVDLEGATLDLGGNRMKIVGGTLAVTVQFEEPKKETTDVDG